MLAFWIKLKLALFLVFVTLFYASCTFLYQNKPSTIIYLKGTCSSGKSTLIGLLSAKDDYFVVDDTSLRGF